MCSKPKIPTPKEYQSAQAPVYRERADQNSTGRRGTILTGGSGIQDSSPTMKKTALGQ